MNGQPNDAMHKQSWASPSATVREIEFLESTLHLSKGARILDVGCGFGRHSIELAKRGYSVVGIDASQVLIEQAKETSVNLGLRKVEFRWTEIQSEQVAEEFDVVICMSEGCVGLGETEDANTKILETVFRALRPDGQCLLHIHNLRYAELFYPLKMWSSTDTGVELLHHEWESAQKRLKTTEYYIPYGKVLKFLGVKEVWFQRLYSNDELRAFGKAAGVSLIREYGNCMQEELLDTHQHQSLIFKKRGIP